MKLNINIFIKLLFIIIILSGSACAQLKSSESTNWKFAVLCDTRGNDSDIPGKTGVNDTIIEALSKEIVNEACAFVLVPGDMINGWFNNSTVSYDGQFKNWTNAMSPVYNANISVYGVRGNHEDGPGNFSNKSGKDVAPYITHPDRNLAKAFVNVFGFNQTRGAGNRANGPEGEKNLTYSFEYENAFFVGLDEYIKPHRINQTWLDDQLKKNTKPFVFVFGHEPAFQIKHPDCLAYNSTNRSKFWDSIGRAGCQIYFCGHDHLYDRAHIFDGSGNKIYQMVVGSCGAPPANGWKPPYTDGSVVGDFHNNNKTGYVLVTMWNNNTALVEWKAWNGGSNWTTLDRFNLEGKEIKSEIPWATLRNILLVGLLIVVVIGLFIKKLLSADKKTWNEIGIELKKSWNGETCDHEGYITAAIIFVAIPVVMVACWYLFPEYNSSGVISDVKAREVVQGVTIFAVVYFITQLIERIIELISDIHPLFKDTNKIAKLKKDIDRKDSQLREHLKVEDTKACQHVNSEAEKSALEKKMDELDCLESSRKSRLWAVASGLGIIFSYTFIGLFALVGITIAIMPHWIDVLVSGIIIGGGSKPLHDLISNLEKK